MLEGDGLRPDAFAGQTIEAENLKLIAHEPELGHRAGSLGMGWIGRLYLIAVGNRSRNEDAVTPDAGRAIPNTREVNLPLEMFSRRPFFWQALGLRNPLRIGASPLRPILRGSESSIRRCRGDRKRSEPHSQQQHPRHSIIFA